jgi:hypothetical protein
LCLFLGILQSSIRLKAILQGGPLSRGQTTFGRRNFRGHRGRLLAAWLAALE